jgi:hypothetical protein
MRREPAKVLAGEGVLLAPPLPLKPTVGRRADNPIPKHFIKGVRNETRTINGTT